MKGKELPSARELDRDGWRELSDKGAIVVRQLRHRPVPDGNLLCRSGMLAGEQPVIGVTHHHWTVELSQELNRFRRLCPTLDRITQADDLVARMTREIIEHGF